MKAHTKIILMATAVFSLMHGAGVAEAASTMAARPSFMGAGFVKPGRPGLAPFAFARFCVTNASDCAATEGDEAIVLDEGSRADLKSVNAAVNRAIRPQNDRAGNDEWRADATSGDCEDYVLAKKRRLVSAGFPAAALRIAVARTGSGEGHAVLVVRTDRGDLVLDNRNDSIKRWNATDLRLLKIQSGGNPRIWFDL
jgi:predicted transglutaminase-like cysteine proteinase